MECMDVLPPGFRFHPTDEELINDYLKKKVSTCSNPFVSIIADIDLYKFNPWDLPGKAYFGEKEWFFFSPRDRKYPNGTRPNRAAASGYWKATGTDKPILSRNSWCIGVKKALVFYEGRPPNGNKTNWMMYEYRLLDNSTNNHHNMRSMRLDDWVLCRVREKTGPQEPEPQPEDTKRKSKKAVYNDELEGLFMEEDENVHNISFAQNDAWPNSQQDYQSTHDRTMMLNFDERSSSSHSISYENMDHVHQLNENINGNQNLESMRWFMSHDGYDHQQLGPADHANKRLCSINSSTFLDDNSSIFQIFPI